MSCFKVLATALALTFTVFAAFAQSTVITNFAALHQFTGVSDTHFIRFDNPNFNYPTDLEVDFRNDTFSFKDRRRLTRTWAPDSRFADPATVSGATSPSLLLGSFNATDPSGSWTLLLADIDFGQQSTLAQWGLVVSAVPEPSALGLVGMITLVLGATLCCRRN